MLAVSAPEEQVSVAVSGRRIGLVEEASRLMTICNACRYCEGHCAVFPAMEKRQVFDKDTIDYLANLCHQCGACFHHCQYAAPHEFAVHVPRVFAEVRRQSYADYAWPKFMGGAFSKGWAFSITMLICSLLVFVGGTFIVKGSDAFFAHYRQGFYAVLSHNFMATVFGSVFLFSGLSLGLSLSRYWRALNLPALFKLKMSVLTQAFHDALSLKNLDGGHGEGCYVPTEAPSLARRRYHHLVLYGFLLCFLATGLGTVYHYAFGWIAPYGWTSLPKIAGTIGGLSLLLGVAGLLSVRRQTDQAMKIEDGGMGAGLLLLLLLASVTGLLVPVLRESSLMALALTTHLATVLALFVSLAYGKFVHGLYRLVALIASAYENPK